VPAHLLAKLGKIRILWVGIGVGGGFTDYQLLGRWSVVGGQLSVFSFRFSVIGGRAVERYAQRMNMKPAARLHGSRIFLPDELRQPENQVLEEVREDE